MNEDNKAIDMLVNKLISVTESKTQNLKYDKTFQSTVWKINSDGTYGINYLGQIYNVKNASGFALTKGQKVWVNIPSGIFRNMIIVGISGENSTGSGENAVTSVNGYVGNVVLKTSDLVNDSNYVSDSKYVHTDNNYTTEEKDKLENIEEGANKTTVDSILNKTSTNPVQNKVITARLDEVFQSVSSGKELIASAITDKGVPTDATASFETMSSNISQITGGGAVSFEADSLDDSSVQQYVVTRIGTATTNASSAATRATISTVTNGSAELLITTPGTNGSLYYCAKTYIVSRSADGTISFNSQSYSKTNVVAVIGN